MGHSARGVHEFRVPWVHLHQKLMSYVVLLGGQLDDISRRIVTAHAARHDVMPLAVANKRACSGSGDQTFIVRAVQNVCSPGTLK
jgi:hypothetical protein